MTSSYELRNKSKNARKKAQLSLGASAAVGIGGGLALATGLPVIAAGGLLGALAMGGVGWRKHAQATALNTAADEKQREAWDKRSSLPQNYGPDAVGAKSRLNKASFETTEPTTNTPPKPKP